MRLAEGSLPPGRSYPPGRSPRPGGGAVPRSPRGLEAAAPLGRTPVVCGVAEERVLFDCRTLVPEEFPAIRDVLAGIARSPRP